MSGQQPPGSFFGPSNLVDLLRHRVRCQPEDTAFTFLVDGETEEVHITYRELDRQARAIAAWLEQAGLMGERALLCYPAGLEFIAAFFGCLYAKVVAVPIYPPRRNQLLTRIRTIAQCADAKAALTTESVFRRVRPLTEQTSELRHLQWLATCDVPEGIEQQWEKPDVDGDTLAFLQYTSGSTGEPKGVMLSHANLVHNSALIGHVFEHTRSGLGVFWLPSYHDMGLIGGILQPMYVGRPNVMMSPMSFLQKPFRWLSAISRYGGTTSGGPNFAYDLCVRRITPEQKETLDLSSWLIAFNGADPIHSETLDRFAEAFGPCGFRREAFYPCYGLAESTLIVSGGYAKQLPIVRSFDAGALTGGKAVDCTETDSSARLLIGCGESLPDGQIVIADSKTCTRLAQGEVGEIWASGPSIAQGYWQQPEATKATFEAFLSDTGQGPFLRTGDLGFLRDGELFVTGRIKDMIIVHGVNHYPHDIELTVEKCHERLRPGCGAAFAVEADASEKLVVVYEVERRTQGGFDEIFDSVRRAIWGEHELAPYSLVLIKANSVSKTSSGKIQRHACRAAYLDGSLDVVAQWHAEGVSEGHELDKPEALEPGQPPRETLVPESPTGTEGTVEVVLDEVRKVAKERARTLTLDSNIADTGLDSLERMEILASLEERYGARFPEEILPELETCRQVVWAVEKYLGMEPRPQRGKPADTEIPDEYFQIEKFPECVGLKRNIDMLNAAGLEDPFFHVHHGVMNNTVEINGRELINYSSFNYIGMSGHPAVSTAAKDAIDRYGTSASASRLVSGENDLHRKLESELARLIGTEDAIAFVAGHSTNESVIGHLFGPGDLILHDSLAHNSIVQGAILSGARRRPFVHNDPEAADRLLNEFRHEYRRVLIAIEGVYSMDGDFPNLPEFIDVKRRHKALLLVDEAHSIGTMGPLGHGIGEHFDIDRDDVELWMGTVSKALGSCGGYIAGSRELVRYLKYTTPGFVFATGMAPAAAAAALAAIRVLRAEPERAEQLRERSALFLSLAKQHRMNTGTSNGTPVVPVILGSSVNCLKTAKSLMDRGVNARPILHPAVEESAARLRFFINSTHTEEQIRYTIEVLADELAKLDSDYREKPAAEASSVAST